MNIPSELQSFVQVGGTVYENLCCFKFVQDNSILNSAADALDIPLVLTVDGFRYILSSSSKIRQSHHRMRSDKTEYDAIVETILELEDRQYITTCKVSTDLWRIISLHMLMVIVRSLVKIPTQGGTNF